MLRIFVISLVVANLLLLGFQASKPAPEPVELAAPKRVSGDPRIPTIHLFSEMVEDEELLSGGRRCFSIGPFDSAEDRDAVRTRLERVSSGVVERETEALVEKGYWVFMPPYVSLLEANRELLSLKALGLNDVGIIYEGEWQNAISLGYFLRQENAQRRKSDLEQRGFEPRMMVRRQSEPRYWLDYEQDPGSELPAIDMRDRPNDFMRRAMPCPERSPVMAGQPAGEFTTSAQSEAVAGNIQDGLVTTLETGDTAEIQEAAQEPSSLSDNGADAAGNPGDAGDTATPGEAEAPATEAPGPPATTDEQGGELGEVQGDDQEVEPEADDDGVPDETLSSG